jgi:hypothetical protein
MNQKRHSSDELGVCQLTAECHLPCDGPPRHPRFQFAPGVIDGPQPPTTEGLALDVVLALVCLAMGAGTVGFLLGHVATVMGWLA